MEFESSRSENGLLKKDQMTAGPGCETAGPSKIDREASRAWDGHLSNGNGGVLEIGILGDCSLCAMHLSLPR